jgi:hypothetical protein
MPISTIAAYSVPTLPDATPSIGHFSVKLQLALTGRVADNASTKAIIQTAFIYFPFSTFRYSSVSRFSDIAKRMSGFPSSIALT